MKKTSPPTKHPSLPPSLLLSHPIPCYPIWSIKATPSTPSSPSVRKVQTSKRPTRTRTRIKNRSAPQRCVKRKKGRKGLDPCQLAGNPYKYLYILEKTLILSHPRDSISKPRKNKQNLWAVGGVVGSNHPSPHYFISLSLRSHHHHRNIQPNEMTITIKQLLKHRSIYLSTLRAVSRTDEGEREAP